MTGKRAGTGSKARGAPVAALEKILPVSDEQLGTYAHRYDEFELSGVRALMALRAASHRLNLWVEGWLAAYDLTPTKFSALIVLNSAPARAMTLTDISRAMFCTPATASGVVDRLEREGLVRRQTHPEDLRSVHIVLERKGRARLEKLLPEYFRRLRAATAGVSEARRTQLIETLLLLSEGLDAVD